MVLLLPRRKPPLDVADVFAVDLWTGNGTSQTITSGLDMTGEDGMVWVKSRSGSDNNLLFDTERGALDRLISNGTLAESTLSNSLTSFNSDGFSLGSYISVNQSATTYAGWSFRKAPKFFDVVTYTGTGSAQNIAHNLGSVPGMIIVKRTDGATNWFVYHRSNTAEPETEFFILNSTGATFDDNAVMDDTLPTSSVFTVGTSTSTNASGGTYVAYIFAHDDSDSGLIQCGSYTGNGSSTGPTITLGWEPQWVMIKRTDSVGNWMILDSDRATSNPRNKYLRPSASTEEYTGRDTDFNSSGFQIRATDTDINASGGTYIYTAIRKED